jgi:hypothetical protein
MVLEMIKVVKELHSRAIVSVRPTSVLSKAGDSEAGGL